ncbi:MAG: aspartate aminotransferase family protein [Chloroflexi bacterium]|nr:aspartate aminotransferase family protein [Chloroflexota bacterium]
MVSKRTQELLKADAEHVVHGMYNVGRNIGIVMEKAHGIYLVDTEGKKYIDLSSQLICVNLGHRRQEIIDAVTRAMNEIDFVTTFFGMTNPYIVEVSQKLAKLTPGDLNHFHYTSGGGEAVDSAVKLARFYWSRKGLAGKYKIISLYASYHGSAGISTNLTGLGRGANQNPFGPVAPGFVHVPPPYSYRCMFGDVPDCCQASIDYLESVIQAEGPESIAAFIAESIMGAGGVIEPPPGWWPQVAELCKKYDILLIVDEVMSGFARSGKMFACEHWGVIGDMMTMAKGIVNSALPFAAVALNDKVYDVLKDSMMSHGFTYSGHPIAAAASSAALDIYVRDKVAENAAKVGKHIKQRLEAEFVPLPCVGYADGRGVFQALELVKDKKTKEPIDQAMKDKLWQDLFAAGIFTRVIGWRGNRMFICPPCVITIEEADKALDTIKPIIAGLKPK